MLACWNGNRSNRPQVKSSSVKSAPSQSAPDQSYNIEVVMRKIKKIITNTFPNRHSCPMLSDHFDHGWLVLYANSFHYNCVNRESYPYNWDVVWPETTIHRTRCDHDNHYTANAACQAMITSSRWHIQQDNQRNLITIIIWHLSFAVQTNERSIRWQNLISTCRYTFKYFYKMCFNIQCNVRCCHFSQPSHLDYFLPVFYDLLALHVITGHCV